jgi:peptide/nickel transport system substrate-binding protein
VADWQLNPDRTVYTFTLRDGLKFHNGRDVTAADMTASIKRWLGGISAQAGLLREFVTDEPFTVVNDKTFTVNLKEPYGLVTAAFSKVWSTPIIVPKEIADLRPSFESLTVEEYVGSGVYKFSSWEQGNKIVLDRFEEYVPRDEPASLYSGGTTAYVDTLIWLEVPDEETKIAGLETGEWDVVDGAGFDFYNRLRNNPDLLVPVYKPGHRSAFGLIPSHPPFDNLKARQAALFSIDVERAESALGPDELWDLCPALYYCGTPLETDAGSEWYNHPDVAKAKMLLDESPYAGETMTMMNPTDYATITPIGIVIKQMLEDVGFVVDMPALDWATVVTNFGAPDTFAAWTDWLVHWCCGDPVSDPTGSGQQVFWPKIPYVLDLRREWAKATDPAEKRKFLDLYQIALYENVYYIYLGQFFSIYPNTKDYKNFEVKAVPFYANAWLER